MLEFAEESAGPKIKVIGVGGGGGNSINTMIEAGIQGVDFIAANTDAQVLETNLAPIKVQIGRNLTRGLGAGANPEIGAAAAIEDAARLGEVLRGADMVFVTAGMGGGTGTGAAPVIAQVARDLGALTVGVVTKPFVFEGMQRKKKAASGIEGLGKAVDALIVIPNDRLVALAGGKMTMTESFRLVDSVCLNAVRGISDLVLVPGLINVDFADVRTIMTGQGRALMGSGRGQGDKRAVDAAQLAINSPLLEDVSINGATGILVNITGGPDLTLAEVNEACGLIQEAADPDANIIFGSVIDPNMGDEVRITVIATGFQNRTAAEVHAHGSHAARSSVPRRPSEAQMPLPMHPAPAMPPLPAYSAAMPPQGPPLPAYSAMPPQGPSLPAYSAAMSPQGPSLPAYAPVASGYPPPAAAPVVVLSPAGAAAQASLPAQAMPAADVYFDPEISTEPYPTGGPWAQPMTHVPVAAGSYGGAAAAPGGEWQGQNPGPGDKPIIRPAVASPISSTPGRRTAGGPASFEELGIEDSELDSPTFMRRRTTDGMTAPGYRLPGDK